MTSKRNSNELHESTDTQSPDAKKLKLEENRGQEKSHPSMSFPEQLKHIIDHEDESKGTIFWKEDGCTFWISTKDFIEQVLRVRFSGTKYESFVRKLNRWGFKRLHDQSLPFGTVAYRHDLFKRGHPELLKSMSGVKKKELVQNELFGFDEPAAKTPAFLGATNKRHLSQLSGLSQRLISVPQLTSSCLDRALLQKQMFDLLGHSVASPFQSPLNVQQELYRLNSPVQRNDAESLLNQLLQQRMARLSAAQVASLQIAAAPCPQVTSGSALLRLQQQLNGGVL